jgi:hypothetical protein
MFPGQEDQQDEITKTGGNV